MYTFRRRVYRQYTEVYKDSDLIYYLSYYHCLQTVRKSFNKQKLKGQTTVLRCNRFQESRHHDVIGKIEYTVSEPQTFH